MGAVPEPFVNYQLAALGQLRAEGVTDEGLAALQAEGRWPRAFVRYTILGVGNNPGYAIIFAGGVLIAAGIPWAFYVKPWLVRRRSARLRAEHGRRAGEGAASEPGAPAPAEGQSP
jgi:hypothetical protein